MRIGLRTCKNLTFNLGVLSLIVLWNLVFYLSVFISTSKRGVSAEIDNHALIY